MCLVPFSPILPEDLPEDMGERLQLSLSLFGRARVYMALAKMDMQGTADAVTALYFRWVALGQRSQVILGERDDRTRAVQIVLSLPQGIRRAFHCTRREADRLTFTGQSPSATLAAIHNR